MAGAKKERSDYVRQRLQTAEVGVEAAVLNVLAQEEIVERLKQSGHSTEMAERLLQSFRDILTLRMTARDRIKAILESIERIPRPSSR